MQAVLTLVEPQATGIGGGAFIMYWDGKRVQAYDGRETAPAGATENLFMRSDGKPMEFSEGQIGGRSVGVPGVLRALSGAPPAWPAMPWARLFQRAITLAENGFPISQRLYTQGGGGQVHDRLVGDGRLLPRYAGQGQAGRHPRQESATGQNPARDRRGWPERVL